MTLNHPWGKFLRFKHFFSFCKSQDMNEEMGYCSVRKTLLIVFTILLVFVLAACGGQKSQNPEFHGPESGVDEDGLPCSYYYYHPNGIYRYILETYNNL